MSKIGVQLPGGWAHTSIGDIVEILRGVSYDKSESRLQPTEGLVPMLRATNIGRLLTFEDLVYVPESRVNKDQYLKVGDIVLAASSGSLSVVGKAAPLTTNWHGAFGAFCMALRPTSQVDWRSLALFLQTREYRDQVSSLAAGVNINNLRQIHISGIPVRLPPLAEQRRIVTEIERHFSRLDAAVAALERVKIKLARYRSAVLHLATEGRLRGVSDTHGEFGLSAISGRERLSQLLQTRSQRWNSERRSSGGQYKSPPPPDTEPPHSIPSDWGWATILQLTDPVEGLATGPFGTLISKSDFRDCGVPVVGIPNITKSGFKPGNWPFLDLAKACELERYRTRPDDLIVSRSGTVGEMCLMPPLPVQPIMSTNLMRLRPLPNSQLTKWLVLNFQGSRTVRNQLAELCKGSSRPFLNLGILQQLAIAIPPTDVQDRILADVDQRLSITASVEATIDANLRNIERLRGSILRRAFEGRLVSQNPADEPASTLLERIRRERAGNEDNTRSIRKPRTSNGTIRHRRITDDEPPYEIPTFTSRRAVAESPADYQQTSFTEEGR